jgi:hypothetical protein
MEKSPLDRHNEICARIKEFVENKDNFNEGEVTFSEIGRILKVPLVTISKNLLIMYHKKELHPSVLLKTRGRRNSVFYRRY